MTYGTVNADVIGTSVAGSNLGAGNASTLKNRIINGAMVIDQRNAGASLTTNGAYTVDRWYFETSNTGNNSAQQVADAPNGFYNSLKITNTTGGSVSSGTYQDLVQKIEGFNVSDLNYGTSSPTTLTASFWVKTSVTGTYGVALRMPLLGTPAGITQVFTISSANTWTQISVQFPGYTSGSITASNTGQLSLYFFLAAGSSYQTTAGSWTTTAGGFIAPSTISNTFYTTSGATWQVTGVQLEVGSSATGFEYRQYGTELTLCQRYFWKCAKIMSNVATVDTCYNSTIQFPVTMRTTPTLASGSTFTVRTGSTGTPAISSGISGLQPTPDTIWLYNSDANWTTGTGNAVTLNGGFSAEL
jgi:hypothetical protein